jgi:hypothetical protein
MPLVMSRPLTIREIERIQKSAKRENTRFMQRNRKLTSRVRSLIKKVGIIRSRVTKKLKSFSKMKTRRSSLSRSRSQSQY